MKIHFAAVFVFVVTGLFCEPSYAARESGLAESPVASPRAQPAYGKLPLHFEANAGQADGEIKFLAQGSGYGLFLTATEAVLSLRQTAPTPSGVGGPQGATVRLTLVGANPQPQVTGEEKLAGTVNYFQGNDPAQWRVNVSTFGKVKYHAVYPGVDLIYYGNQRQLEYDFIVAPGVDPQIIQLVVHGAKDAVIDAEGRLVLRMAGGEIVQHAPIVYQELHGERSIIAGRYRLETRNDPHSGEATHLIGFALGDYDRSRPLVIDPVLVYSKYFGGNSTDIALAIAVDSEGHAYVTGQTSSTNFPTVNPFQNTLGTTNLYSGNAFVAKLSADGASLIYATYLGGSGLDSGSSIAVDSAGHAYVAGSTSSTNFPTVNAFQSTAGGGGSYVYDAFVVKLNPSGSALLYSTYLGGSRSDYGEAIAVDNAGQAHVTGATTSTNLPIAQAFQPQPGNPNPHPGFDSTAYDAFVAKFDPSGSALVYATYLGGAGYDGGVAISLDPEGNAYIAGNTGSTNFPTANAFQPATANIDSYSLDGFLAKLSPSGTTLLYSTYFGGTDNDEVSSLAVDSTGHAFVAGLTYSANLPIAHPIQSALHDGPVVGSASRDGFVAKFDSTGGALIYSTYLGGNGDDWLTDIALDTAGSAHVTGTTHVYDGLFGFSTFAFLAKLSPAGSEVLYSIALADCSASRSEGIAVDNFGNAYVTGGRTTNHPPSNPYLGQYPEYDAFVLKIASNGGESSNSLPIIRVTSPAAGSIWGAGEALTISAGYMDLGGRVGRVAYYDGAELLAVVTNAPFSMVWSNALVGDHSITAVAMDNQGGIATSCPVNFSVGPAPLNDHFSNRILITGEDVTVTGSNQAASREFGEPDPSSRLPPLPVSGPQPTDLAVVINRGRNLPPLPPPPVTPLGYDATGASSGAEASVTLVGPGTPRPPGGQINDRSVWWSWTAPTNGSFLVSTEGSDFATTLAIYTGSSVSSLTGHGRSLYGNPNRISFAVVAGTTYHLRVAGAYGAAGNITLRVRRVAPPSNDHFANRLPLGGVAVVEHGSNIGATTEAGEPSLSTVGNSVWWSWTAPISGSFILSTAGSESSTTVGIYTGASLSTLIAAEDGNSYHPRSEIIFSAREGETYQIVVDTAWGGACGGILLTIAYEPPPPNDHFANRIPISGAVVTATGTTRGATREPDEPEHWDSAGGQSIWWTWTAPSNGNFTVTVNAGWFDPLFWVYTGSALSNLVQVTGGGAIFGTEVSATFRAASGVAYQIVVATGYALGGDLALHLRPAHSPANDDFAHRLPLSGGVFTVSGSNIEATREPGEPAHDAESSGAQGGASVWWTWTAPSNGMYVLSTTGSDFQAAVAVYTGTSISNLNAVAVQVLGNGPVDSGLSFLAAEGVPYQLAVEGNLGNVGQIQLSLRPANPPGNDHFENRIPLSGMDWLTYGSTIDATLEPIEPEHNEFYVSDRSVWWTWTAPVSGVYHIYANGTNFTPAIAVYSGSSMGSLALVRRGFAFNFFGVTEFPFEAVAGAAYQIAVAAYPNSSGVFAMSLGHVPSPPNDHFANRTLLSGNSIAITSSNKGATREPGEPSHFSYPASTPGSQSVWWTWTAPTNGQYIVSTEGSDFETVLAVYVGNSLAGLTFIAGDVFSGANSGSRLGLAATAGATYQIAVAGFPWHDSFGNIALSITHNPPPANDDFANRLPLSGATVATTGTTMGASAEPQEPPRVGSGALHSIWWTWVAPSTDVFTMSVAGDGFYPVMGVYTGTSLAYLDQVAVNAHAGDNFARLSFNAVAGVAYQIVADTRYDVGGAVTLEIRLGTPPVNDAFAARLPLSGATVLVSLSNVDATREPGEPDHSYYYGNGSIWWSWTAPSSGTYAISTVASSLASAYMALYTGTTLAGLERIPYGNATRIVFQAVAGTVYQIAVEGTSGRTGEVVLEIQPVTSPANDNFASRILQSGLNWTTTGSNVNATREPGEPYHGGFVVGGASVWWSWTAPASGCFTFTVTPTTPFSFSPIIGVHEGSDVASLTAITFSSLWRGQDKFVTFAAVAGHTYQFAVDGYDARDGSFSLSLSPAPATPVTLEMPLREMNGRVSVRVPSSWICPNILEASTNLVHWVPVATNRSSFSLRYLDGGPGKNPMRFYRIRPEN